MKTFILNPFIRLAGSRALIIGISGILVTGILAWLTGTQLDGALDIHYSSHRPAWYFNPVAGLLNWLSLSLVFGVFSHLFSRGHFRWIDVLGTQAFARIPLVASCLVPFILDTKALEDKLLRFVQTYEIPAFSGTEILGLGLSFIILVLLMVWLIAWTWKAYTYTANLRGGSAVLSFIGGLLVAEIISKLMLSAILGLELIPDLNMLAP